MLAFMFFQKEKGKNGITGFMTCSEKEKRKENFALFLEVRKMTGKRFSNM